MTLPPKPGELASREGPNRYQPGDAIVTGATVTAGWSRVTASTRYVPADGGGWRNRPVPVLAKEMAAPFAIARSAGATC